MTRWVLPSLFVALQACGGVSPQPAQPGPPVAEEDMPAEEAPPGTAPDVEPDLPDGEVELEPGQTEAPPPPEPFVHPFADVSDETLAEMLENDPGSLGCVSLGGTSSGALYNGVQMPTGAQWKLVNPRQTWGTQETVDNLVKIIAKVNDEFPNTQPIHIGDISEKNGGYIRPHISHQSGRDVDIGFYYTTPQQWYMRADSKNLDMARTWALLRATITETDVKVIFIDRKIQKLLREHAESIGEDSAWLDTIFGGPTTSLRPLIRHEPGHRTHIHIRFYNPIAQETGRRIYRTLIKQKKISPPTYYIKYRVKRGDTLSRMAKKFRTSVRAIKRANGLRSSRIYAKHKYRIPRRGGVRQTSKPLVVPARRLPPLKTRAVAPTQ